MDGQSRQIDKWRAKADQGLAQYTMAQANAKALQGKVAAASGHLDDCRAAQAVVQAVASAVQQEAHARLAAVVTRCLQTVFPDDPYTFQIYFEEARGKTQARMVFERAGLGVDPMGAAGGGVVDVAAFALRVACLMLARPAKRRLVVLDEPFKFLSKEYQPNVRAMLLGLSRDLGVQFIMVTHIPALQCGKVVELG